MENQPRRPSRQEKRKDANSTETLGKDEPQTQMWSGKGQTQKITHIIVNVHEGKSMEIARRWVTVRAG